MPSSGSKDFSVTRTSIIEAALRKTGQYDVGEPMSPEELADAAFALNVFVKGLAARDIDLPWRSTITLFLQPAQQSYRIGPSGDEATASYRETTLSTDEATNSTSLGLTSTTGMTNNDRIGVKLDDGTIHWTTISNVGAGTIAAGLASAASAGNAVYSYTSKTTRPRKLIFAHRRDPQDYDTPVDLIGEIAYRSLSQKGQQAPTNQVYYSPTLTNGTLYVWPANDGSVDKLVLIGQLYPDDFDAASNEPEFPIEWTNVLIYGTAAELGPEYGLAATDKAYLESKAEYWLNILLDHDVENASVIFGREA